MFLFDLNVEWSLGFLKFYYDSSFCFCCDHCTEEEFWTEVCCHCLQVIGMVASGKEKASLRWILYCKTKWTITELLFRQLAIFGLVDLFGSKFLDLIEIQLHAFSLEHLKCVLQVVIIIQEIYRSFNPFLDQSKFSSWHYINKIWYLWEAVTAVTEAENEADQGDTVGLTI